MNKKKFNKLRHEILSDKSITGISYDPRSIDPEPEIILIRKVKQNKRNDRH